MNVLSLFDGMACGMLAMQSAGIPVSRYVAFEIDKYAVQTSTHNFPMIEQRGDVFTADFTEFLGFDFLIGGSPCTYWSIAQKNNRETIASGMGWELFSQYVRALVEAKPRYFVYENNKSMSKAIRESIDQAFGFEAVEINSAKVSAQNRQRLYWVGKRNEDGTYSRVNVEQPEDRGILLRDILESGMAWQDKAYAYTTRCQGATPHDTLGKHRHTMVAEPVNVTADGKAQCLRATYYKDGIRNMVGNTIDRKTCVAVPAQNVGEAQTVQKAIPEIVEKKGYLPKMFNAYNRAEITEKPPCLSTGSMVTSSCATLVIEAADGKTYPVYEVKDGYITIKGKQYPIKLPDGLYIIRKLTVRECMQLQTVPEWYAFPVSDTQAYKMLGNGWTVEVIAHLLNACMEEAR